MLLFVRLLEERPAPPKNTPSLWATKRNDRESRGGNFIFFLCAVSEPQPPPGANLPDRDLPNSDFTPGVKVEVGGGERAHRGGQPFAGLGKGVEIGSAAEASRRYSLGVLSMHSSEWAKQHIIFHIISIGCFLSIQVAFFLLPRR